jgi:hypothetical protein
MSRHDEERMKQILRAALPPVEADAEPGPAPSIDLWPAVLRRVDEECPAPAGPRWAWFDGALLAGLAILAVAFPASIPLLVYYL